MAKLRHGILGPLTGKIGPVVAVLRNKKVYIRALPKKSNKPRTEKQIASQEKFKLVHQVIRPLKPYLCEGFKHLVFYKTAMDLAFTLNYHRAVLGTYPDLQVDYSQLVIAEGRLLPLKDPLMVLAPGNQLKISWAVEWRPYSKYDDQVMLVLYCPALSLADGSIHMGIRFQQECLFTINKRMKGHDVHVFVVLIAGNGNEASNSQYLGRVVPL